MAVPNCRNRVPSHKFQAGYLGRKPRRKEETETNSNTYNISIQSLDVGTVHQPVRGLFDVEKKLNSVYHFIFPESRCDSLSLFFLLITLSLYLALTLHSNAVSGSAPHHSLLLVSNICFARLVGLIGILSHSHAVYTQANLLPRRHKVKQMSLRWYKCSISSFVGKK